ncbi:hypothetical protein [Frondihabitans sp. PAMC 28766]|nr:hypothetical protein [Frondihabitans sp. PAMC 28766]
MVKGVDHREQRFQVPNRIVVRLAQLKAARATAIGTAFCADISPE